jgi:CheY-like chemotaxis protein/HPt (histidine-containing phosphotransfer) domain-containing protein
MRADVVGGSDKAIGRLRDAWFDGDPYQVALLDRKMPGIAGPELAASIRADDWLQQVKLVLLTESLELSAAREQKLRALFDQQLSKPILSAALRDCLYRLFKNPADPESQPGADIGDSTRFSPQYPGTRILLVEDNPINQEVAKTTLTQFGCTVDIAHNGHQALDMLVADAYDLVLMDCQMPVMDGYEATAAIRRLHEGSGKRVPIVALTANAMQGDRQKCAAAGMDDFLSKPYSLAELRAVLARWLPAAFAAPTAAVPTEGEDARDAAAGAPSINRKVLESLRELDPAGGMGLAHTIMRTFLDSSRERVASMEQAIAAGDGVVLGQAAHALKSSAANVGAETLSGMYRELEQLGRENRIDEARRLIDEVRTAHRLAVSDMQALLEEGA